VFIAFAARLGRPSAPFIAARRSALASALVATVFARFSAPSFSLAAPLIAPAPATAPSALAVILRSLLALWPWRAAGRTLFLRLSFARPRGRRPWSSRRRRHGWLGPRGRRLLLRRQRRQT
jgi:hypothetical protein